MEGEELQPRCEVVLVHRLVAGEYLSATENILGGEGRGGKGRGGEGRGVVQHRVLYCTSSHTCGATCYTPATCYIPATCYMLHATCYMLHATCYTPHAYIGGQVVYMSGQSLSNYLHISDQYLDVNIRAGGGERGSH